MDDSKDKLKTDSNFFNSEKEKENNEEKFSQFKINFNELGFPPILKAILNKNGFDFLSDLLILEKSDFFKFPGIDNKNFKILSKSLDNYGLKIPLSLNQDTSLLPKKFASNEIKSPLVKNEEINETLSWNDLENFLSDEKANFENFETNLNKLFKFSRTNNIIIMLSEIFSSIDNIQDNFNLFTDESLLVEKKILKFCLLKKFLKINSFNNNWKWINRTLKNKKDNVYWFNKKLFILVARLSGFSLQEIGNSFKLTREGVRQDQSKIVKLLEIDLKKFREISKNIKLSELFKFNKNIIEKHINEFGRLPIRNDMPTHNLDKEEFYIHIINLKPAERIKLLQEYKLEISDQEFDYHYEYFKENDAAGKGYWKNFDFLKEYIYRHAISIGEPDLMPKQTSFTRRGAAAAIQNFGGQSAVANKIGLKYQGQLVNDEGGRRFWSDERLLELIEDTNNFYNQNITLLPHQIQIHNFIKSTDKEIYKNKRPESIIAALTKLGNLDWSDVAERFNKQFRKSPIGMNTTFLKSFVRDLGEHLAVLTPSELYVLFQAQGINRKGDQFSRTYDVLIDAVQSGEVNKKDLLDWSNNIEVPSIKDLLALGSDLRRLTKEERESKLLLRRSKRIKNKENTKIINISELTKEDLPSLDPSKALRALDKAATVIESQGSDLKLIEFLKAKAIAKLWDSCFANEDNLISNLNSNYFDKDSYSSQVKQSFLEEYYGAKNLEIPSTYKFRDLKGISREPKLMQKLVAFRVIRDKRMLNLSGTGTGKTLSAILSAQVCKVKRIFISCPNGVIDSWERSFRSAYPDAILHIKPNNWQLNLIPNKTNVILVNHERLQDRFSESLLKFCINFQTELIIIDEIHQSKSRKENISSQRRELIKEFIRISRNLKEDIRVLGLSATPVINNLYEGRSLIELVTDKVLADVKGDDINSCMNLYQHFVLNSIRMNPGNLPRTKLITKEIDTSNLIHEIIKINNSAKLVKYHDLERLFVLPKLKVLEEIIEKGIKTIIFITLIEGTLIPITNWLKKNKYKFSVYTGNDKEASEEGFTDSLDEFINGHTDILVATVQCAGTGIDGLQSVCNRAIFFQLPWTSTEFEQSVGRLDRDGTVFESIEVFLPITFLELPNGDNWSWCESKLERIRSKKDIAKAAVDGDLPDNGSMISPQEATKYWLKWLKRLEEENT